MAKMVQDLSKDYLYDDEEKKLEGKHRLTPKQKNYVIGLSCLGVFAILVGILYGFAANVWLKDYETLGYLKYAYSVSADGKTTDATVMSIDLNSNYPSTFRIPSEIKGHKITSIADNAFAGATRLKKVIMTDNIITIGSQAFGGCNELSSFVFSKKLNSIGTNAFINTKYEESWDENSVVTINNILLNVGNNYFDDNSILVNDENSIVPATYQDCKKYYFKDMDPESKINTWMEGLFDNNDKLVYVETPSYLDEIPTSSFNDCSKLKEVKLTNNIVKIGDNAFSNCSFLEKININKNIKSYGNSAFENTNISFDGDLSEVTYLGESVFKNCKNITSITYSNNLNYVSKNLFSGCTNLSKIVFPNEDNITSIGIAAFESTAFKEFKIPKYVNSLSDYLFHDCKNLTRVYLYNASLSSNASNEDDSGDTDESSKTLGVNRINAYVFAGCSKLTSIKLYEDDGSISPNCIDDNTIYLPQTLSTTSSSNGAEKGYAFYQTAVKNIIIPSSTKSIGEHFIDGSTSVESFSFEKNKDDDEYPYSLISIGNGAFANTTNLNEISIPFSITSIGPSAFLNATGFKKITIEEPNEYSTGLSTIAESLFKGCTNLEELSIPSTISNIKKNSFSGLKKLDYIIVNDLKTIESNAFENNNNLKVFFKIDLAKFKKNSSRYYKNWKDETTSAYVYSENKPSDEINESLGLSGYWHYDENNKPVIW